MTEKDETRLARIVADQVALAIGPAFDRTPAPPKEPPFLEKHGSNMVALALAAVFAFYAFKDEAKSADAEQVTETAVLTVQVTALDKTVGDLQDTVKELKETLRAPRFTQGDFDRLTARPFQRLDEMREVQRNYGPRFTEVEQRIGVLERRMDTQENGQ